MKSTIKLYQEAKRKLNKNHPRSKVMIRLLEAQIKKERQCQK
jgi:hypothetical protein